MVTLLRHSIEQTVTRIGLALGSGGARGFAHIGVLRVLERASIRPAVVCGTSSGAIVGLAYWVGDAIAPGLASIVPVSTRAVAAPAAQPKSMATTPVLTKRADKDARR